MSQKNQITELMSDVREQLAYDKELDVEMLDVRIDTAMERAEDRSSPAVSKGFESEPSLAAIPRETPHIPITAKNEPAKPSVKRPSRLTALPPLSNRPT